MNAEQAVLGCVLRDNRVYRDAAGLIRGDDFADARLGGLFDHLGRSIAAGEKHDQLSIESRFADWGVRGVGADEPWRWIDLVSSPTLVGSYAEVVKNDSLRRTGRLVLGEGMERLKDTAVDPAAVWESVKSNLTRQAAPTFDTVTLADVLKIDDNADWIIPGLMERKDRLILTGHEGLGKTTLVRQMLILPAAGIHPFTFDEVEPITALVIDAENTGKQWMRATKWMAAKAERQGATDPTTRIHMRLSGRLNLLDPAELGGIHQLIDRHNPDIVFIGPLYRLALKMNNDDDIAPVIAALDSIRDRGVALVIEAHAGHAVGVNGVRDVRPRGSSALLGWPEFGYGIRKDTEAPDLYEFVAWRGARETRDWPEKLRRGAAGQFPWHAAEEY